MVIHYLHEGFSFTKYHSSNFPVNIISSEYFSGQSAESGHQDRKVTGLSPDSTQDPLAWYTLNPSGSSVLLMVRCGSLKGRYWIRCRPRHLTKVRSDEVCPRITLNWYANLNFFLFNSHCSQKCCFETLTFASVFLTQTDQFSGGF